MISDESIEKIVDYFYFTKFELGEGPFSLSYFGCIEIIKKPCDIKFQKSNEKNYFII